MGSCLLLGSIHYSYYLLSQSLLDGFYKTGNPRVQYICGGSHLSKVLVHILRLQEQETYVLIQDKHGTKLHSRNLYHLQHLS